MQLRPCRHFSFVQKSDAQTALHYMTSTPTPTSNPYTENGFVSRRAYLENLADEYGVDRTTVFAMAQLLGPTEDFDGLISALEDEADRLAFD